MRARAAALVALPFAAVALAVRATYPRIGAVVYGANVALEARLAGLTGRTADVAGETIAFYEGGPSEAPTVVLLHGYSADRGTWVRFARHLTRDFHVVVPDLAGHGTTPYVAGAGFSIPAQAARVAGLLDGLGVERAHLVGSSMGGFVAATFARTFASRTRSLALLDAAGVTSAEPSTAQAIMLRGLPSPFLMDHPDQFAAFYALTMARPPYVPGFVRAAMAADYVARRDLLAEVFEDWYERDLLDDHLHEITAPTLVVHGSEDQLVHPSAVDVWATIPGARVQVYDGIGHLPMLEVPRRSAADYRSFLADL